MTFFDGALLVLAAAAGGALNAVAGGGSFFTFPALVVVGVQPIIANATSTVVLWPGSLASVFAYRSEVRAHGELLPPLLLAGVLGGAAGALLLRLTPPGVFVAAVPYLLLVATLLFAFGPRLTRAARSQPSAFTPSRTWLYAVQLLISVYGGYFGGGMGMMLLATFALFELGDIHRMNALKTLLGAAINGAAVITFVAAGMVQWPLATLMLGGSVVGGYAGAFVARRIQPARVRFFVIAAGFAMTGWFFWRA